MKGFVLIIFICSIQWCSAQVGIRAYYNLSNHAVWSESLSQVSGLNEAGIHERSYHFGVDYWLRFPNLRWEFMPEISYEFSDNTITTTTGQNNYNLKLYGLQLNSHIYPFDFYGDCECPTFSKQGALLKKGFFTAVGGGLDYYSHDWQVQGALFEDNGTSLSLHVGVGLDVGISDLLTLTPIISYKWTPSMSWEGLSASHNLDLPTNPTSSGAWQQWRLGIRIGLRADYRK